jgi:hypothetical protein
VLLALLAARSSVGADDPASDSPGSPSASGAGNGETEPIAGEEEDRPFGPFYPSLTVLSAGAGIGPMLEIWQRDLAGSGLGVHAAAGYSIRQYQHYALRFGRLPRRESGPPSFSTSSDRFFPLNELERLSGVQSRFDLFAGYRYRDYTEEDFYGIGPGARLEDRADFRLRDHWVELVTALHLSPRFALTARAGLLRTSLGAGRDDAFRDLPSRFGELSAPGWRRSPEELVLTAGLLADLRDDRANPHAGALLIASLTRFEDRDGGRFEFTRAAGDVRLFLPLFSRRHVLATRAIASFDRPDAGGSVPFYLQSSLGGSHVLRGYPAFRFRDENVVAFSAEYRFEPFEKLELALFCDAGQVAVDTSELGIGEMRSGCGGGIRLKSTRRVVFRFDVAHSREATRYLFKLGPSF